MHLTLARGKEKILNLNAHTDILPLLIGLEWQTDEETSGYTDRVVGARKNAGLNSELALTHDKEINSTLVFSTVFWTQKVR